MSSRKLTPPESQKSETIPVSASPPLGLTEPERTAVLQFQRRRQMISLEAQQKDAALAIEEMAWAEALAVRLGIEPADIGTRYAVNLKTMALEPLQ